MMQLSWSISCGHEAGRGRGTTTYSLGETHGGNALVELLGHLLVARAANVGNGLGIGIDVAEFL